MTVGRDCPDTVDEFIDTQVFSRGLDERTAMAYRNDLEKLYLWLEVSGMKGKSGNAECPGNAECLGNAECPGNAECSGNADSLLEEQMETYLDYLSREKGLRCSTIFRKQKVFGYYLSYLVSAGRLKSFRPLKPMGHPKKASIDTLLTKKEVEAFFQALDREYEDLDSDFRRRICLRDQVMMRLLFYHGIDISELLKLEVPDYDRKTATLVIRRKRQEDYSVCLFSHILQQQMDQWLSEHVYFEHSGEYHNRMFLSKLGKPLSMKMVINIFDKYRDMAGIEKMCKPKDLKNSLGRYAEEMVRELG